MALWQPGGVQALEVEQAAGEVLVENGKGFGGGGKGPGAGAKCPGCHPNCHPYNAVEG